MVGLKPAVIGLIGSAALSIALTVFAPAGYTFAIFSNIDFYISLVIFALCVILIFKKIHPIIIICISAVLGILSGYLL